jgi:PAS domain S-box-containing protein
MMKEDTPEVPDEVLKTFAYLSGLAISRKQAEETLRESEEKYRNLVDNANEAVLVAQNGLLIFFNRKVPEMIGCPEQELTTRPFTDFIHQDDRRMVFENYLKRIDGESGLPSRYPFRLLTVGGAVLWVEMSTVRIEWKGKPATLNFITDITGLKRNEEEKTRLTEQLQQSMKMEAVGRLAGGVAHDFNNLLTGITGNISVALMDLKPEDPLYEILVDVNKAAYSAAALTRQLLAFSRRQIIEPKVLNLNELVTNLHKMLIRLIGEDVELKTIPGEALGAVRADPGQIEQVIINLAVNARDSMPGGGRLVIETANVELGAEYCRTHANVQPGNYVMFAVSDTGEGMSREVKEHLFEPFFTTKPKGRGTGLGLATIYGVIKQAGGSIEVYSEVGKGTTLKVYLPMVEGETENLDRTEQIVDLARGTETILVVEDEDMVRQFTVKILDRLGYLVLGASNGEEALHVAEGHEGRINLLMTDVVMPGMNGRQLADELTRIRPGTAVLFTSGYTESIIVNQGVVEKSLNFIGKPYSPQVLSSKIREVLDKR